MADLETMYVDAVAAAKQSSRWAYRHTYVGGAITISVREPDAHTMHLTSLCSWDYASQADCSIPTARAHLRQLVKAGKLVEDKKCSTACVFRLTPETNAAVGKEIIRDLEAEGLPFEDDWRANRQQEQNNV